MKVRVLDDAVLCCVYGFRYLVSWRSGLLSGVYLLGLLLCLGKQMGRDWWETPHMEPSECGFLARGSWINMNQLELHHARVNLSMTCFFFHIWNPLRCCWKTYLTWAVIPLLLALSLVVNSFPQARYYMTRGGQNAMLTEEGFKHTAAWRDSGEVMKFVSRLLKDDMKATLKLGREAPNI